MSMTFSEAIYYAREHPGVHLIGSNFNSPIAWVDNRLSYLRDATTARWEGLVITDCIYNCTFFPVLTPNEKLKLLVDRLNTWRTSTKNTIAQINDQIANSAYQHPYLNDQVKVLIERLDMIETIMRASGVIS